MSTLSREEAKVQGYKHYLGEPCIHGHDGTRYVSNTHCVLCCREANKKSDKKNKERKRQYNKYYREKNKEQLSAYQKEWRRNNRERCLQHGAEWRKKNRDKHNALQRQHAKKPKNKARAAIKNYLKKMRDAGLSGTDYIHRDKLGYTPEELVRHIESLFEDGMSWDNHGEWHIDHVKPISAYLDEGVTDPSIVNALGNLRPLWAKDNLVKGSRFEAESGTHKAAG